LFLLFLVAVFPKAKKAKTQNPCHPERGRAEEPASESRDNAVAFGFQKLKTQN
jgi:hypothetical protein